jgi:hypothetical protein
MLTRYSRIFCLNGRRWTWGLSGVVGVGLVLALTSVSSGCIVRVYQPLSGLHAPVVVDPQAENLSDVRLAVTCLSGDFLSRQETLGLCRKMEALFEIQGAEVTLVDSGSAFSQSDEVSASSESDVEAVARPRTDLSLELRSREIHKSVNPLSWVLSIGTFTVLPAVSDSTFAQDVVIRDETGFLLVSDSLQGRVIRRFGVGSWLGNAIADLGREKEAKLSAGSAERDLSQDLYGQISQLVFNAKIQWRVLTESAPERTGGL